MQNELIVKSKTEIAKDIHKKDIYSIYGVPNMLDKVIDKEKTNLLNNINCGIVFLDALNKLNHSEDFVVDIPMELREMLKSGKAAFDNSSKNPGSHTPNIRIKGKTGIYTQATIKREADNQAITQSLSNLAMMAMVQSVLNKLEILEEKIEDIQKGQKNDRIGSILGHFKGFMDLYSTFKTKEELNTATNTAYLEMQEGLTQIHLQIEDERKKLNGAPANDWEAFKLSINPSNFLCNKSKQFQKYYIDYTYDIQLYNRLILLSDIVLFLGGKTEAIKPNHKKMVDYCNEHIDESFQKKMKYLMHNHTTEISSILNYNKNLNKIFDDILIQDIIIECSSTDLKTLNTKK